MARRRTRTQRGPRGYGRLPRPPVGTYDPAIDAAERAAGRGYRDLRSDAGRQSARDASDYGIALEDVDRQRGYGLADILRNETRGGQDIGFERDDLERGYGRSLADLLQGRIRGEEDYKTSITNLERNYQRLGGVQRQSANAAGVFSGGALREAAQKRATNQAIERQPIDTSFNRFMDDSRQAESRLGEDRTLGLGRLDIAGQRLGEDVATNRGRLTEQYGTGESTYKEGMNPWVDAFNRNAAAKGQAAYTPPGMRDYGTAGQRLSLALQRGSEDRATQLGRAGREYDAYRADLTPTRYYSAAGLNRYNPPKRRRRR